MECRPPQAVENPHSTHLAQESLVSKPRSGPRAAWVQPLNGGSDNAGRFVTGVNDLLKAQATDEDVWIGVIAAGLKVLSGNPAVITTVRLLAL